jgi:hypothetical protein
MGLGTGIFLMAVGAVLKWGLTQNQTGSFDLDTIGMILFVIGIVATLLSLAFWSSWGGRGVSRRTATYETDGPRDPHYDHAGAQSRTTVREEVRDDRF